MNVILATIFIGAVLLIALFAGYCIGRFYKTLNVVTLTDVLKKPSEKLSDKKISSNAVLQLQDEIVRCEAINKKTLENGDIEVSITVVI